MLDLSEFPDTNVPTAEERLIEQQQKIANQLHLAYADPATYGQEVPGLEARFTALQQQREDMKPDPVKVVKRQIRAQRTHEQAVAQALAEIEEEDNPPPAPPPNSQGNPPKKP